MSPEKSKHATTSEHARSRTYMYEGSLPIGCTCTCTCTVQFRCTHEHVTVDVQVMAIPEITSVVLGSGMWKYPMCVVVLVC